MSKLKFADPESIRERDFESAKNIYKEHCKSVDAYLDEFYCPQCKSQLDCDDVSGFMVHCDCGLEFLCDCDYTSGGMMIRLRLTKIQYIGLIQDVGQKSLVERFKPKL